MVGILNGFIFKPCISNLNKRKMENPGTHSWLTLYFVEFLHVLICDDHFQGGSVIESKCCRERIHVKYIFVCAFYAVVCSLYIFCL